MITETTVDFVVRRPDGRYVMRNLTTKSGLHGDHLLARSFSTREEAERYGHGPARVVKRVCVLEWETTPR